MHPSISTLARGAVIFALLQFLGSAFATPEITNVNLPAEAAPGVIDAINSYINSQAKISPNGTLITNSKSLNNFAKAANNSLPGYTPGIIELPDVPDPKICAANGAKAFYRQPLEGVHDISPVPLSRQGRRRHRRFPRQNQTSVDILDSPTRNPADPNNWLPWTHRPECGVATSYCVFTSASLPATGRGTLDSNNEASNDTSPQGISIITTPEMAAHSLHLLEFPLGPKYLEIYNKYATLPPAFAVRPHPTSPAKGDGVFATRPIRAGEPVIVDRPALLAHFKVMSSEAAEAFGTDEDDHGLGAETDSDRARMWRTAIDQLPTNVADRIYNMTVLPRYKNQSKKLPAGANLAQKKPLPTFSHAENIFASNSFALTIKGYPFKALFPNVAKLNHACQPNLSADISGGPMTMVVWANRDIKEGEELTISYLSELLPSHRRRKVIQRRWGFRCQCDLCTGKASGKLAASDERLDRLPSLVNKMREHMAVGDATMALETALKLRDIYIDEGLMRKTASTGEMLQLPEIPTEKGDRIKGELMADPFGPAGLAETLARLYLTTGDKVEALPQLRAAVAEIGRQTFSWPDPEKARRMWQLVQLVGAVEKQLGQN